MNLLIALLILAGTAAGQPTLQGLLEWKRRK
jgi:hypothetical protein